RHIRQGQQGPDRRRRAGGQSWRPDQRDQIALLARRCRDHARDHAGARSGAASRAAAGCGDGLQLARGCVHVRDPATAVRRLGPAARRARLHGSDNDHRHLRRRFQRLDHQRDGPPDADQGSVRSRRQPPGLGLDRPGPDSRRRDRRRTRVGRGADPIRHDRPDQRAPVRGRRRDRNLAGHRDPAARAATRGRGRARPAGLVADARRKTTAASATRSPGPGVRGPGSTPATDPVRAVTHAARIDRNTTVKTVAPRAAQTVTGREPERERERELRESDAARRAQPRTMGELVLDSASRHTGIALQFQRDGRPAYVSYGELGTISTEIARGLIGTGIEAGDRVAILGLTSADWTLADCGTQCAGAVVTPIYHTNSPEECAYVLADSGAKLIFCENSTQAAKIVRIRDRCPALEHVVLFAGTGDDAIAVDELRRRGAEVRPEAVRQRLAEVGEQDVATLVYTSGTTGPPKGCMLTHANLLATTRMYAEQLQLNDTHSLYQFLPLAHVLART